MQRSGGSGSASVCKICGADARPFGTVDFNKNCAEKDGVRLPRSGVRVPYLRCTACGFIFTEAFDQWSPRDFAERIYNDEYVKVDPSYLGIRPGNNAASIIRRFGAHRAKIACLDYGGGNGLLAQRLRQASFKRAETYDEYNARFADVPSGRFNLVTCFEVFEHEREPHRLAAALDERLEDEGLLFFSTLLQPTNIKDIGVSWWYIGPRNGHVSIYSRNALNLLLLQYDLDWVSVTSAYHLAWRKVPDFAADLVGQLKGSPP